jgi:hypothetical protein
VSNQHHENKITALVGAVMKETSSAEARRFDG